MLLNPVPFRDPEQLAKVGTWGRTGGGPQHPPSLLAELRDQTQLFGQVEAYRLQIGADGRTAGFVSTDGESPGLIEGVLVTPGLFQLLQVQPRLGRSFGPDESDARVVVISDRLWQRRFDASPGVIGTTITLETDPYVVIGVMPSSFRFPDATAEVWVPFDPTRLEGRRPRVSGVVRLRPGIGFEQAREQTEALSARLEPEMAAEGRRYTLMPVYRFSSLGFSADAYFVKSRRTALLLVLGAVGFVLLVACANTAHLFLARAAARAQEVTIRTALGAGRLRLVRQLLTESLIVSLAAGLLGLLFAVWSLDLLAAAVPPALAEASLNPIAVNLRLVVVATVLAGLTGIVAGLLPAIRTSRAADRHDSTESLRAQPTRPAFGGGLIACDIALTMVLVVGAGLLMRSFWNATTVELGFDTERVLVVRPVFRGAAYRTTAGRRAFFEQLRAAAAEAPGVQVAATAGSTPLAGGYSRYFGDLTTNAGDSVNTEWTQEVVSGDYFAALGIEVVNGRTFGEEGPTAPDPLVISRELEQRLWPGGSGVGRQVRWEETDRWHTVIGVVADIRHESSISPYDFPQSYMPQGDAESARHFQYLIARTDGREGLGNAMRHLVWQIDPTLPVQTFAMPQLARDATADTRFVTSLLVALALLALGLASACVYALVSYETSRRLKELGVRIALGASRADITRHVVGRTARLALVGLVVGTGGALALSRLLASQLFGVAPSDPATFVSAALCLLAAAALAAYLPARKAMRVDPVQVLRAE